MALSFLYQLVQRLLGLVRDDRKDALSKDAEILDLRHQLAVLRRQVVGVFAQLDRSMVTKRLRDGRMAKAATGRKAVGAYPYGYRGSGKGRDRDAAPYETEQVAVERIAQLRCSGGSYREIARALDAEGIQPRRARRWSAMSVHNIMLRTEGVA